MNDMKQLLITLSATIVLLCAAYACSISKNHELNEIEIEIYEIEYENHTYFLFSEYGKSVGVVHAPNCNCFNK